MNIGIRVLVSTLFLYCNMKEPEWFRVCRPQQQSQEMSNFKLLLKFNPVMKYWTRCLRKISELQALSSAQTKNQFIIMNERFSIQDSYTRVFINYCHYSRKNSPTDFYGEDNFLSASIFTSWNIKQSILYTTMLNYNLTWPNQNETQELLLPSQTFFEPLSNK